MPQSSLLNAGPHGDFFRYRDGVFFEMTGCVFLHLTTKHLQVSQDTCKEFVHVRVVHRMICPTYACSQQVV